MRWDDFEGLAATDNWPGVAADDPAFMVYTSGTTADPKGVLHSANSLLAEVWQSYPDNDPASRVMSPYPAGHRSEEHTSEIESLMRLSYAVFCLKKNKLQQTT